MIFSRLLESFNFFPVPDILIFVLSSKPAVEYLSEFNLQISHAVQPTVVDEDGVRLVPLTCGLGSSLVRLLLLKVVVMLSMGMRLLG